MNTINDNIRKHYNCSISFLGENGASEFCSNELTVTVIKTFKKALLKKHYVNCQDLPLCNTVIYDILNPPPNTAVKMYTTVTLQEISFKNLHKCYILRCGA